MLDRHALWFFIIGILAMLARIFISAERLVMYGILRTISTGAFIGVIVGLGLLNNTSMELWQKYALLGIAVALSEDLMLALVTFGKTFKDDPRGFIEYFLRKRDDK